MLKIVRFLKRITTPIHQSYFVVALAVGIVAGTILGLVLRLNYFSSPLWLATVAVALIVAYLKPRAALIIVAFIAGMLLSFFRIATE